MEVPEQDGLSLPVRQRGDCGLELEQLLAARRDVGDVAGAVGRDVLVHGCRGRGAPFHAGAALVAGDRREPAARVERLRAREQSPVRGEERLLRRVLRLVRISQKHAADAENEATVLVEERGDPPADILPVRGLSVCRRHFF